MTLCDRPRYAAEVLAALAACDGVAQYTLVLAVEPGEDEVEQLAKSVDFCSTEVTVGPARLGVSRNTWRALTRGFELADYVVHLEDDNVFARDALLFFEHCGRVYARDPDVFAVCGTTRRIPSRTDYHVVERAPWFRPVGWATWQERWLEMRDNWDFDYRYQGWGPNLANHVRRGRACIFPRLARVQHIGLEHGVHTTPASFERDRARLFAGDVEYAVGPFVEATETVTEVRGTVME